MYFYFSNWLKTCQIKRRKKEEEGFDPVSIFSIHAYEIYPTRFTYLWRYKTPPGFLVLVMVAWLSSDHCGSSKTHSEPEPELRTEDGLRAGPWGQGMTRDNLLRTTTTTNKNIFGQLLLLQCLHWVDHGNYLLMGSKNYQFLVNKLFSPPHEQKLRWWKYGKSVLLRFDCANTKYYVVIHLVILSDKEWKWW